MQHEHRSKANGKSAEMKNALEAKATPEPMPTATETSDTMPLEKVVISAEDLKTVATADDALADQQRTLGARYEAWMADERMMREQIEKSRQDLQTMIRMIGKKHGLFNDNTPYGFDLKTGTFTRR